MDIKKAYIKQALEAIDFKQFTDIQSAIIPKARNRIDIVGTSRTGTGKTHAFLIPIFERLDFKSNTLQVLIMAPTRELAQQIVNMARHIASFSDETIDIKLFAGGKDRQKEIDALTRKQPAIAVGTPGRIHDLVVKTNVLKAYTAHTLVIDEADMALEIGFLSDIDAVARVMPKELHMMVFSATIPEKLKPFLRKYLHNPHTVALQDSDWAKLDLTHRFIKVRDLQERDKALHDTLKTINPYLAMIFANRKETVERLSKILYEAGYDVLPLHGDLPPRKRKQVLRDIDNLRVTYIVASDMASRGLDIKGISHIINYELPQDPAFFVHRIGRSGRMGASGTVISLYDDKDTKTIDYIERHGLKIDGSKQKRMHAPHKKDTKRRG